MVGSLSEVGLTCSEGGRKLVGGGWEVVEGGRKVVGEWSEGGGRVVGNWSVVLQPGSRGVVLVSLAVA